MTIKAGVGVSDNISGILAIEEAIKKSTQKVKEPKFTILLSSINYENEFKEILKKAKELLPNSEIVGCTGAAILAPDGVYVRGIGAMSISGDIDVGVGVGLKSRTKPEEAGKTAMKQSLDSLKQSKYKNRCAILFVSGMKFPNIPGMKQMMKMGISKKIFPMLSDFMAKNGTGPAKYEEVLEGAAKVAKSVYIFGAGSFDDFKGQKNYQFINTEFHTDSVVALTIASNNKININFKHGLKPTGKKIKITKAQGSLAFEINGKPAWQGFKEAYDIPDDLEEKWKSNPVAMTIGEVPAEKDKYGNYWIIAPLCVIGDSILFAKNIEEKTLYICRGTGQEILSAAEDVASEVIKDIKPSFVLIFSPVPRVMTMMEKIDVEREYIKGKLKETPFLGFYCCASEVFLPKGKNNKGDFLKCLNETIAMIAFDK